MITKIRQSFFITPLFHTTTLLIILMLHILLVHLHLILINNIHVNNDVFVAIFKSTSQYSVGNILYSYNKYYNIYYI